ncbi:alpha/beta hydrolase [Pseudomonas sp. S11A4]|uniref:alpha/beta hydrolase n=1 Tax=Pseudomonas sp. S11A4 TaxID=1476791 RepID=UPI0031590D2E
MTRLRRRRLAFACMAALIIGVPTSCAVLEHTERTLLFRIEPGNAGWYRGLPGSVQELDLQPKSFKAGQNIHAWWWPAEKADAPAILYLHGVRWNLTGQLFRIEQLRAAGYSVLAIDYRGFGQSKGDLPSESSVYEDARVAWERFQLLQPDPNKRLIYGHSLGGAVAIDLAAELGQRAARSHSPYPCAVWSLSRPSPRWPTWLPPSPIPRYPCAGSCHRNSTPSTRSPTSTCHCW